MIPFAYASVMTHAGAQPLGLCCCDVEDENLGGSQFPETPVRRRVNPFLKADFGVADSDQDSGDTAVGPVWQAAPHHRHQRAPSDENVVGGITLAKAVVIGGTTAPRTLPDDDDYLDFVAWLALVEASDDDRRSVAITLGKETPW